MLLYNTVLLYSFILGMQIFQFFAQAGIVGFESPASQYEEAQLSISELLVANPSSTHLAFAKDNALSHIGIYKHDILIVNKNMPTKNNPIVVATLNGEPIVRLLDRNKHMLQGAMSAQSYTLRDDDDFCIQGVVDFSIRLHTANHHPVYECATPEMIDDMIIKHPSATYFGLAQGHSMINVGIFDGDILIVDRHQFINDGAVIVATLNGEFVCKKLDKAQRRLVSTKPYSFYQLSERDRFQVEGCVIASVRLHSSLNMSLN